MSISAFFLRQVEKMVSRNKKTTKSSKESGQQSNKGNTEDSTSSLAPTLWEVASEITANILKVINEKPNVLSQILQSHCRELDSHAQRITEAEDRITVLEDTFKMVWADVGMEVFEQQVELSDHIDDLDRRKTICIVATPEGAEGDHPTCSIDSCLHTVLNN